MGIVLGIDVGGSTTKIIGLENEKMKLPVSVKASDPVASLFGAFGKFMYENQVGLDEIEHIMITGVGSSGVSQKLYGLPTSRADEFIADGLGGKYFTGLDRQIVVSMGTGTSLVQVDENGIRHIGGIGVGGGTIVGLSSLMLGTHNMAEIIAMAEQGDITRIDLQIKDISHEELTDLPMEATASNFGKVRGTVSHEDIAVGIVNMVLQCIGKAAVLSSLNSGIRDFVLIGNLAKLPQSVQVTKDFEKMFHVRFHIPEYAEYSTALGAALVYLNDMEYVSL
ncbi:MAG: type II pantothenate kinase [Lachnospiraceae bacterium]|nr:type II pantothenate kinase [Lachnospiraceae bacterium]